KVQSTGTGSEAGDINVNAPITMTAAPGPIPTLSLVATGSVFINQPITTTNGALVVAIFSGATGSTGSINIGADIAANQITLTANGSIVQLNSAVINTLGGSLSASSVGGASLGGPNLIGTVSSFTNTGSGNIFISNAQGILINQANAGPGQLNIVVT